VYGTLKRCRGIVGALFHVPYKTDARVSFLEVTMFRILTVLFALHFRAFAPL
jgi:hypothetical protein